MIRIRKFALSDLPKVMKIERVSFPYQENFPKFLFEKYYREYPNGFIVAENENEIRGYTIGRPKNGGAEIISLAVDSKWRRKGIGTKLTNFLIGHFKGRGLKEVFLHVRTKNKAGISFYQKLGFKILKTIKNYYRNGNDAYLMRKEMGI